MSNEINFERIRKNNKMKLITINPNFTNYFKNGKKINSGEEEILEEEKIKKIYKIQMIFKIFKFQKI